jgi:HEPN domain-containing protein
LPERDPGETSGILRKKAEEDATAVREFAANQEMADSIGFHAQQAVEKWLKAVIASRGARHEQTHDIDRLLETRRPHGQDRRTASPAGER